MGKKNKSAIRLGGSYITMMISISLVLLILGLSGLILLQSKGVVKIAKENILITVMFKDSLPEADMLSLQKKMQLNEKIKTCEMVSSDEAAKRLFDETGEDFVTDLGYIPIPPSLDITVKSEYGDSANIEALVSDILKESIVGNVYYDKDQVQDINANTQNIMLYLLGFAVIVFLISYSLISNTIRLAIYSKRFIIRSMLLVGATRSFIRRPFLMQSLWMGLVSSLIALIMLEGVLTILYRQLPDLKEIQDNTQIYMLFGGIVLSGMFISWLSSYSALNRYIKMKTDFLYL